MGPYFKLGLCRRDGVRDKGPPGWGWPKPRDRVLIRHREEEPGAQRRSHVETERRQGGRLPPAQDGCLEPPEAGKEVGRTLPGDSGWSSALGLGPLDVRCQISITVQTRRKFKASVG